MNEEIKKRLEQAGTDIAAGTERFMGNEALYWKFILKFPDDGNAGDLETALKEGDVKKAFQAVHNLKGVCGNLSFRRLYEISSRMTELLRAEKLEEARELFPEFQNCYLKLIDILREYR